MATVYSWRSLADIPFPDSTTNAALCRGYLFLLKNLLLGQSVGGTAGATGAQPAAKWTLVGSSNGVTFGLDSTERLGGNIYDASKWVWAFSNSTTTAHSWFVLYNATLGVYWLVDCKSNTTSENGIYQGFCTAMPTGGSLTAAPTLAGVQIVPTSVSTVFESAITGTHRANFVVDTANGYFLYGIVRAGVSPGVRQGAMLWPTRGPTQRVPWVFLPLYSYTSSPGVFSYGAAGGMSASSVLKGRSYDGSVAVSATTATYTSALVAQMNAPNVLTGSYELLPPILYITTTGQQAVLALEDLDVCGDTLTGNVTPSSGTIERCVVGQLLTPISSAITL